MHHNTVHYLAFRRHRPEVRAKPSNELLSWKPGLRSDDDNRQMLSNPEHPLPDEQARVGLNCARKQRRENQQPWRHFSFSTQSRGNRARLR